MFQRFSSITAFNETSPPSLRTPNRDPAPLPSPPRPAYHVDPRNLSEGREQHLYIPFAYHDRLERATSPVDTYIPPPTRTITEKNHFLARVVNHDHHNQLLVDQVMKTRRQSYQIHLTFEPRLIHPHNSGKEKRLHNPILAFLCRAYLFVCSVPALAPFSGMGMKISRFLFKQVTNC